MEAINITEAIKLAELRAKSPKKYDKLMANLFSVYADFIIFEHEFEKTLNKYEQMWRKKK